MSIFIFIIAFLKNAIYGTSVFFTGALTKNVDVLDVLSLRFILSFVTLWLLKELKIVKINVGVKDLLKKKERTEGINNLILAALFEPVIYMFFETLGISMTTGITTAVILSLGPITSLISESVLLKEKATPMQKVFLAIGIIGVIYIAVNTNTSSGKDSVAGIIFLMLAVLSGSLYMVFSRKASRCYNFLEVTYVSCIIGMAAFNFINVIRHIFMGTLKNYFAPYFDAQNMVGFIFLSIISTIIATSMNNYALKKMQVSQMAAFGGVSTFVTVTIGALLFDEKIYYYHIIGFILIITRMIGVSYITIKRDSRKRVIRTRLKW